MKKTVVVLLLVLGLIYFRHVPLALLSQRINGVKYYSLFVSGGETNGYAYYLYEYPYLTYSNSEEARWRVCSRLHKYVLSYIQSVTTWPETGPYYVANASTQNGFTAYIKANDKVIFVKSFPDYGGAGPTEEEKKICADTSAGSPRRAQ